MVTVLVTEVIRVMQKNFVLLGMYNHVTDNRSLFC